MADTANPWDQYQGALLRQDPTHGQVIMEAAIVGIEDGSVWTGQGSLKNITQEEVKVLVDPIRENLLQNGASLGGLPCTVISDGFHDDGIIKLKIKKPASETGHVSSYCICKTTKALVIVKGYPSFHAGFLLKNAEEVSEYLKNSGF